MRVTVVGAGNMGRGIGTRVLAGGNDLKLIGHEASQARELAKELGESAPADTSASVSAADGGGIDGDVVVLAVPYEAADKVFDQYRDQLSGKIVVDITNPVDFATFDRLVTLANGSAAEKIAKRLPTGARLVKALTPPLQGHSSMAR